MKRLLFIIVAVAAFFIPAAYGRGEQLDVDSCVKKIEKRYEDMKDLRARFHQKTRFAALDRTEHGEGTVFFKKGGKMRWEYSAPQVQKFILDGKNLWVYLPEEKQVMKNNFNVIPSHIITDLFRSRINLRERFHVTMVNAGVQTAGNEITLELSPVEYDPTVKKLHLTIDAGSYLIVKTSLEPEFGNTTDLTFSNIEVDTGLDDTLFEFTPPPGVELFEAPQLQP